jgi:predicted RNA-binding protein with PUA-like domain
MNYWLMKNEPESFSIDDLERVNTEPWDGIRNYQVRNFIRDQMSIGDKAYFYHSSCKVPGIVGMMEICSEAYPDHTAWDPEEHYYDPKSDPENPVWLMVDVKFISKLDEPITLQVLRTHPELEDMRILQRGNRLSITPLDKNHWDYIQMLYKGS